MKVIVENLAIEYDDIGSGKVILFLHGWKDNLKTFDDLLPFLSSKYRIIRIDLPGFGKSGKPSESWVLDDYVKFINEFIFKLNLKVDTFVGHSLGGRILIKGVSQGKLKSNKLILIASAGIAKRKTLKNYFLMFISKIGKFITYIPPFYFFKSGKIQVILSHEVFGLIRSIIPFRLPQVTLLNIFRIHFVSDNKRLYHSWL